MTSYAVTGASRGLGFEFVTQLSSNPSNNIFALVRNISTAKDLNTLASQRKNIHVITCDITNISQLQSAAAAISAATGGSLDIFIQNAAWIDDKTTSLKPTEGETHAAELEAAISKSMQDNVLGVMHATNIFLPLVRAGKQKKIVVLTTAMVDTEFTLTCDVPFHVPYCMSKAALNVLLAKYAVELKPEGIQVLPISPGFVATWPKPLPAESQGAIDYLTLLFQKFDPAFSGPSEPKDSIRDMLQTIEKSSMEQSGRMLSHHGDTNWL